MVTLQDLQNTLDTELQNTLKAKQPEIQPTLKNQEYVKTILWPRIKGILTQITNFNGMDRGVVGIHIYKWLNEQGLHATPPTRIILSSLKGKPAPDPDQVHQPRTWLPL